MASSGEKPASIENNSVMRHHGEAAKSAIMAKYQRKRAAPKKKITKRAANIVGISKKQSR